MQMCAAKKYFKISLLFPLLMLPGCLSVGQKEQAPVAVESVPMQDAAVGDNSPVLVKINGKPIITMNKLDAVFDKLMEAQPQYKEMMQFMPNLKSDILQGLVGQAVIEEYIAQNNIDTSPEYQKELEMTIEQVKHGLNYNYFNARHSVDVSEQEMKRFYDEHKDKSPDLIESQGGVKAEAVSFKDEQEAKAFMDKAKASRESLEKLAADEGLSGSYHDFKLVNAQSMQVAPTLKAKISKISSFPAVEMVQDNGNWWVIKAHSKVEPVYVSFEEIKPQLEKYLKQQKQAENFEKLINKYKSEYKVEINDEPLKVAAPEHAMVDEQVQDIEPVARTA